MTISALSEIANAAGFVLHTRAIVQSVGIDADVVEFATTHFMCRLGSDPSRHLTPVEFEGTPRECAAFLIGWADRAAQRVGA
jgi:hypothetical protein